MKVRVFLSACAKGIVMFSLALIAQTAFGEVRLDTPKGGWRHSGNEAMSHRQEVNYPASSVNTGARLSSEEGLAQKAAISGQILNHPKTRKPHLMVVNGAAMPLSVNQPGYFARPYAFPPGANSLEIKSADRKYVRRVSFYDTNASRQKVKLRVVLSWDTDMTDVDLHLISPDGEHVFYGNRVSKNGGSLDVDVTTGFGPEIYAITQPPSGTYQVYANYYGGKSFDEDGEEIPLIAQVAIITNEGTADEKQEVFRVPMRNAGELTFIRSFAL